MDRRILIPFKKTQSDFRKWKRAFLGESKKGRAKILFVPMLVAVFVLIVILMPGMEAREGDSRVTTLRVPNFPISISMDREKGTVQSAWLRTPAGARRIGQVEGLSLISESKYYADVDGDKTEDLLWRISFNSADGEGVHLWIGVLSQKPKIIIQTSPYVYTRWDSVPAKIDVPKSIALYVAPSLPTYGSQETYRGIDCYSFVYTVRLTPEGAAFVPVPSVYEQLALLLSAGMRGEYSPAKRLNYIRMLNEFRNIAKGNMPRVESYTGFEMVTIDTIPIRY